MVHPRRGAPSGSALASSRIPGELSEMTIMPMRLQERMVLQTGQLLRLMIGLKNNIKVISRKTRSFLSKPHYEDYHLWLRRPLKQDIQILSKKRESIPILPMKNKSLHTRC